MLVVQLRVEVQYLRNEPVANETVVHIHFFKYWNLCIFKSENIKYVNSTAVCFFLLPLACKLSRLGSLLTTNRSTLAGNSVWFQDNFTKIFSVENNRKKNPKLLVKICLFEPCMTPHPNVLNRVAHKSGSNVDNHRPDSLDSPSTASFDR